MLSYLGIPLKIVETGLEADFFRRYEKAKPCSERLGWVICRHPDGKTYRHWSAQIDYDPFR